MTEPASFIVVALIRSYAWGAACRLRLDGDVQRHEKRWGHDRIGGPLIHSRSFDRPAGWEVEVTLVSRGLKVGDRLPVDEIINTAKLWTNDPSPTGPEPRPGHAHPSPSCRPARSSMISSEPPPIAFTRTSR